MKSLKPLGLAGLIAVLASAGFAQSPVEQTVGARRALMRLQAYSLGQLFMMAQGKMPYDAKAADVAAKNLTTVTSYDIAPLFPKGSDDKQVKNTHALPEIWQNEDDFFAKYADMHKAAVAVAEVAGNGLDGLKGAIGGLGHACGACHKTYRAPLK
jgi:cytochrome c556